MLTRTGRNGARGSQPVRFGRVLWQVNAAAGDRPRVSGRRGTVAATLDLADRRGARPLRPLPALLVLALLVLAPAPALYAGVIKVPGDYPTIQAGIDAATVGDVVEIADGVYTGPGNRDIDFLGKAITVRGENGPEKCIVDCDRLGRGFIFQTGESRDCILEGVTVTGGLIRTEPFEGGGVLCIGASPTIRKCQFINNRAGDDSQYGDGGGLYVTGGGPQLVDCGFADNLAERGGALILQSAQGVRIARCHFRRNLSNDDGGAIVVSGDSSMELIDSRFTANVAKRGDGGALSLYWGKIVARQCVFQGNTAYYAGGGISVLSGDAWIDACKFVRNTTSEGGALYVGSGAPRITSCVFTGNRADAGGAVYNDRGTPFIANCTIANNRGSAIRCDRACPEVVNTVIWNNDPVPIFTNGQDIAISYSVVQGGWPGEGNLDLDPAFAFPDDVHLNGKSPCVDAGTMEGVIHPDAIDADGAARVIDGDGDRLKTPDIGAFEYDPGSPRPSMPESVLELFVTEGEPDPQPGALSLHNAGGADLQWRIDEDCPWLDIEPTRGRLEEGGAQILTMRVTDTHLEYGRHECTATLIAPEAPNPVEPIDVLLHINRIWEVPAQFSTIQAALDAAQDGDTVRLADGTYKGAGNKDLDGHGKRVRVVSVSGPENCIIDCEGEGRGFTFENNEIAPALLEGLTIRNGSAMGSGVYCDGASPTIRNCTITDGARNGILLRGSDAIIERCHIFRNRTSYSWNVNVLIGAGIACQSGSRPRIIDCTLEKNAAHQGGGGIGSDASSPTIIGCTIRGNYGGRSVPGAGGGIYCSRRSSAEISNCLISGNLAAQGGGLGAEYDSSMTVTDTRIEGNSANYWGGGVLVGSSNASFTRCTVARNGPSGGGYVAAAHNCLWTDCTFIENEGPGLIIDGSKLTRVWGCLFSANQASPSNRWRDGGGLRFDGQLNSRLDVRECVFERNSAHYSGGGAWLRRGIASVDRSIFIDNSADSGGGGLYVEYSAPSISNCVFVANRAKEAGGGIHVGIQGLPAVANCTLFNNEAGRYGGGVSVGEESGPTLTNCILWDNRAPAGPQVALLFRDEAPILTADFNNVMGGRQGIYVQEGATLNWGRRNIDADPRFVDPQGGNLRLAAGSPGIDAGDNGAVPEAATTDFDGRVRFFDDPATPDTGRGRPPIVDMGAFEFGAPPVCTGQETLRSQCIEVEGEPAVRAVVRGARPGARLTFQLDGGEGGEGATHVRRVSESGGATAIFTVVSAGVHDVSILEC